jgi:hypothetical protein
MRLYRPVGQAELDLIAKTECKRCLNDFLFRNNKALFH